MILPSDAEFLTNLILQRTRPYIAVCGKEPLRIWTETGRRDHLLPELELLRAVDDFVNAAVAEISADVDALVERICGHDTLNVVSVGCGSGIAEAMLCQRVEVGSMLLIDTEEGGTGHGFQRNGAGYSSLAVAAKVMRDNDAGCSIMTWNPRDGQAGPAFSFDVLFSLYAMGFHFPTSVYDKFMRKNAKVGSLAIYHDRLPGMGSELVTEVLGHE